MPTRDYTYYDLTVSICSTCKRRVFAKIIFQESKVYMLKHCMTHGKEKILISTDIDYYKKCREYIKPSEMPVKFNTETVYECPYDCGLCPDHEQHSCVSIVEVTDRCNLSCPTCYAESSPKHGRHRSLAEINKMFDAVIKNEKHADVLQISDGEPTIHPDFFEILALAKTKPIRHLMLNTNGIKIAKNKEFVKRLAEFYPGFEVYLQFDSFQASALERLRGIDLTTIRQKAIDNLNEYNLSTTLVVTLQKGVNDHEIGEIIQYALKQDCVRGVTFQPTQVAGRTKNFKLNENRYTLSEARSAIIKQSKLFQEADLLPVPCNPDALVMGYALKYEGDVYPLTRHFDPGKLLEEIDNTIVVETNLLIKEKLLNIFSSAHPVENATDELNALMCCLPKISAPTLS